MSETYNTSYSQTKERHWKLPSKLIFFSEYIYTLSFKPYVITGSKIMGILKGTVIFVSIFVFDFICDFIFDGTISWKPILYLFASYFMYLYSSYSFTRATDMGPIYILIYNLNSSIFLLPLYTIYRILTLFIKSNTFRIIFLNCMFVIFFISSFITQSLNIYFYDHTTELFAKISVLRFINQTVINNLLFFGIFWC